MRLWRTNLLILLAALCISSFSLPALAAPYLLMDVGSGRVLEHEDAFRRWYPASLTKLMTAYVVFRAIQSGEIGLDSPVHISEHAANEQPSKMGYSPGSLLTLDNALKIIMVISANDITTAIAESVGGSETAFVERMNAEAQRLGMTDSHFVNAHGLPKPDQYTTARDLAVLVRALRIEFPQYAAYFSIEGLRYGQSTKENTNLLIGRFDGADGMKTGYICASGFNLIATATRGAQTLAAIVLGAHSDVQRAELAADLLTRGFGSPAGGQTLASLRPSAPTVQQVADIHAEICSKDAVARRIKEQDEQGRLVTTSPFMEPMKREPRLVAVGLIPKPSKGRYANVPIPTPRPAYPPQPVTAEQGG